MNSLLPLFANNLLPVFLAAGTGYILGKSIPIEARTVSRVVFYIFSPCLVFILLTNNQLSGGDLLRMAGFASLLMFTLGLLTWIVAWGFKFERSMVVAVLLTALLPNAGNFGLSVNQFAFGEAALAHASLFFVTSGILTYTVGVFIASLGKYSYREALFGLFKIPTVYAVILALIFVSMDLKLPTPLHRTTTVLAEAAIPSMLVLLGLNLQRAEWTGQSKGMVVANTMRLFIAPAIALGLSLIFGLQGAARQAGILEASMPTAVMTTVLATEFDVEPSFVTMVVFSSTLLSPLTLTPLLAYLGG